MAHTHNIVILGAGYVGMYTALGLRRKLRKQLKSGEVTITLLSPESYMTYQPFLPETAAGSLEPRHVVVNLRRALKGCRIVNGWVTGIQTGARSVSYTSEAGEDTTIGYQTLVIALGSVSRLLPIPGLNERGIGVKSVGEAVLLRNHVLRQLDVAASTTDPAIRARALSFVVVGGGFAGIETLAELENMSRAAVRDYPNISAEELRWVLVEATGRILPELGDDMGRRTTRMLLKRDIDVRLNTRLESAQDGTIVLSDGTTFESETLVWTAGVKANPVLANSDLSRDKQGRVRGDRYLRSAESPDVWVAGDCAAVPDLTRPGQLCPPSAQHAMRQAKRLAANIVAVYEGKQPRQYRHKNAGAVAGLGLHQGAAQIYGIKLSGLLAWLMHRTYHAAMMPTVNRKIRVVADWTLALLFRRDVVSLGEIHTPRAEFERAHQ